MINQKKLRDDIEWLQEALKTAEQYSLDIFDVVSTVKNTQMLAHNVNYINSIKATIEDYQTQLADAMVTGDGYE